MKKVIIAIVVIAVVGFIIVKSRGAGDTVTPSPTPTGTPTALEENNAASLVPVMEDGTISETVKEFALDSFMKMDGATFSAGFSVKDITVKKGDRVRITVNNTAGVHDFVIDEFDVKKDTPEGQKTVIEFVADKAGDFTYYCSKYNHRELGQVGTLHVTE